MKEKKTLKLVLTALFMAIGLVLPFFTGQIPTVGKMLLPMHLPVLFCGFICGPFYGLFLGATLPVVRSMIFGVPVIYPSAVSMAFELSAYGFFSGYIFGLFKKKNTFLLVCSLAITLVVGRIIWGITQVVFLGLTDNPFTFKAFIFGGFIYSFPGIILQFLIIPSVLGILNRSGVLPYSSEKGE